MRSFVSADVNIPGQHPALGKLPTQFQGFWLPLLALPVASCGMLGESLSLSRIQLPQKLLTQQGCWEASMR